ncbi:Bug family tripartite tricarboxylate transporter substrate binding protein [Hydrogenophaga sp. BPS33]|uniref:Bug family tripartite tricarboxylate transporter substrate binding protein n=1 Tax=Hydrogenophaga sp. BPS33 TaxID=2651974 RepID=UPI0013203DBB|nr:tripartite tricarboxylate transporter substrate binding protein [Hydrogenophaga sp. BPS33]QHE85471.1 tripartite tricarboxylate transporter substrate binding protein [Hydrogenophaga sp. BPS33]
MKTYASILAALLATLGMACAHAQDAYPNKPIKLIVPYPAGGALDSLARPIAAGLGKRLGQNVVVENRPGGNLIPATVAVTRSPADGYTLYYTLGQPFTNNQFFFKSLPYDVDAYTPIAPIGIYTYTFQVANNSPFKTLKEFIEHAKQNPMKLTNGNTGATSPGRLASELFMNQTDIKLTQVPYQGGLAVAQAVIGAQVDFMLNEASSTSGFMRSGQVRTFAVNAEKRLPAFPDIPTLAEAGYPNVHIPNPYAVLLGPKGIPDAIVAKIARELAVVMESDEVKTSLNTLTILPLKGGPAEVKSLIEGERKSFGPVIKSLNITLD